MKRIRKYRIQIEDESRLQRVADITLSPASIALICLGSFAVMILIAGILVMLTPLRTLLPGYLKQTERAASEDNLMRLDSLLGVYERNQTFLDNTLRAFDIDRIPSDTALNEINRIMSPDSLLPASALEQKFVSTMEEREKFNISVLAPLAADGMMFCPVSDDGIFTMASRTDNRGVFILGSDQAVRSVADGSVLAAYYSTTDNSYTVIVQHARGFITRYDHLGLPLSDAGQSVLGGQMIALPPRPDKSGKRSIEIMMWHNSQPLVPYEYLGDSGVPKIAEPAFEDPRGR